MTEHRSTVAAVADGVGARLRERGYPDPGSTEAHPLARAALQVPDDLCVLVAGPDGWLLAGACLCAPSYWRLEEKIGRPLSAVHAPVVGLEAELGGAIAGFLDRLPAGRHFERRNWNLHRSRERFHPEPERWEPRPTAADCPRLCIRSERQTFCKPSPDTLLFTIGVSIYPLDGIRDHPQAVADLLAAIGAMSTDERRSFGYRHHGAALVEWLRSLLPDG